MIGSVCEDAMGLSRLYSSEVYRYWACIIMYVQRASIFSTLANTDQVQEREVQ